MENAVRERIKLYLSEKRSNSNQLSKQLGISQPTISRQISGTVALGAELISGLLNVFPELSAEWLFRGTGPMEFDGSGSDPELKAVCIDQAKEILRLKLRIAELEGEKKELA